MLPNLHQYVSHSKKFMTSRRGTLSSPAKTSTLELGPNSDSPSNLLDDTERGRISVLEREVERNRESYVTRERAYKQRIFELEEELQRRRRLRVTGLPALAGLANLQAEIVRGVEAVQERAKRVLTDQEHELQRSFQARLFDLQVCSCILKWRLSYIFLSSRANWRGARPRAMTARWPGASSSSQTSFSTPSL
jgi:hypothetical protein